MKSEMKEELEKRVKYVVSLSKEIPWYVRKYKELGIDPDEIKSPQDLLKAYEKGLYTTPANLPELVYYKHPEAKGPFYTSGTTGKPKEIWLSVKELEFGKSQFKNLVKIIFQKDERVLNCYPEPPATSGYWTNYCLSTLGYNFTHFPAQKIQKNFSQFVEVLKEFNPTVIMGLTTFVYRLPILLTSVDIKPNTLSIKKILTAAEPSTVERRKVIGENFNNAEVYDLYASSENGVIAYELQPFTDEHIISYPETLLFLTKDGFGVEANEIGDIVITNLYPPEDSKPYMILLNYKIGDWAKCVEREDNGIVTSISEIRREAAYLAGAKLNPQEVEKCIEELTELKEKLSGEYCIINYYDNERKAVGEIRVESRKPISIEDKKMISERLKERIYSSNIPVKTLVEVMKDAKLLIEITNPGELYKGYEQYIKPGKPKRLLVLTNA
ncbi:MAG: AMP-binding protein [Candidatus Aenigmatarchaeota archaeon]